MKSERRHELEKNELANWLGETIRAIKPYQNAILGIVLAAAIGSVGLSWWNRQSAGETEKGWDAFYAAFSKGTPGEFEDIAAAYPDTNLAAFAVTMAGDLRLASGCGQRFVDKAVATQELNDAREHYHQALDKCDHPMLRQRATFGLARTLETLGSLDEAIERYQEIGREWPQGAYAAAAARRLEDLQKPATKKWYDQFAKFEPKPELLDGPGMPGLRPEFDLESLPDDGPIFKPRLMDLQEKGAEEATLPDAAETDTETEAPEPGPADAPSADTPQPDPETPASPEASE